jgi:hypothetical protein
LGIPLRPQAAALQQVHPKRLAKKLPGKRDARGAGTDNAKVGLDDRVNRQGARVEDQAIMLTMSAIQVLLRNSIDYAGLFPPASLPMSSAVANYARYRAGEAAWALGRFILPANRLPEFEAAVKEHVSAQPAAQPWRLSALAGPNLDIDVDQVTEFNTRQASTGTATATVDTLEVKASSAAFIEDTVHRIADHLPVYFEVPVDQDPGELIAAIARGGSRAKVRTGGVTVEAFPKAADLIRFLQACIRAHVPFKATAGLHHPVRAEYRLTYAPDSPRGMMFGFLNLFLATSFLRAGMSQGEAACVLEEASPTDLKVSETGVAWRDHRLGMDALRGMREDVLHSFGSCSFTEPISELEALHLLEPRVQQA